MGFTALKTLWLKYFNRSHDGIYKRRDITYHVIYPNYLPVIRLMHCDDAFGRCITTHDYLKDPTTICDYVVYCDDLEFKTFIKDVTRDDLLVAIEKNVNFLETIEDRFTDMTFEMTSLEAKIDTLCAEREACRRQYGISAYLDVYAISESDFNRNLSSLCRLRDEYKRKLEENRYYLTHKAVGLKVLERERDKIKRYDFGPCDKLNINVNKTVQYYQV